MANRKRTRNPHALAYADLQAEVLRKAAERRAEERRIAERLAEEAASLIARPQITEANADGSRWRFTPAPGADLMAVDAVRAKLAAIKPHRDPKPRKPESMETYAARMARVHTLDPVGQLPCSCERGRKGCTCIGNERLPDDADEGAPRETAARVEVAEAALVAAVASGDPERLIAAYARADGEAAAAGIERERPTLRAIGAGAWSRRQRIAVIGGAA